MKINIRHINENDKEVYLKFANTFYNSSACLHPVPEENLEKSFYFMLNNNIYSELFFIEADEKPVGYCMISKTFSQEAASMVLLVEELYIVDTHRSLGIATKVFNYLFDKYNEFGRIRLEVMKGNERAIKLYKKLGFVNLDYLQMIIDR